MCSVAVLELRGESLRLPWGGALTFLPRPALPADQVILPEGVLDRIRRHVVGIGEQ